MAIKREVRAKSASHNPESTFSYRVKTLSKEDKGSIRLSLEIRPKSGDFHCISRRELYIENNTQNSKSRNHSKGLSKSKSKSPRSEHKQTLSGVSQKSMSRSKSRPKTATILTQKKESEPSKSVTNKSSSELPSDYHAKIIERAVKKALKNTVIVHVKDINGKKFEEVIDSTKLVSKILTPHIHEYDIDKNN